jgi:hypothetical protein
MWFSARSRLRRELESLALYNDKGIAWGGHSPEQVTAERTARVARIEKLVQRVGTANVPPQLTGDMFSSTLESDSTGKYVKMMDEWGQRQ